MEILKKIDLKTKVLAAAFIVLGLLTLIFAYDPKPDVVMENHQMERVPSVDTFVPRGHTLIGLELTNGEFIDAMIGDMGGVVDLYLAPGESKRKPLKVGSKLKIVRAPLNPQIFAILVKLNENPEFIKYAPPYFAVIHNPEEKYQGVSQSAKQNVQIEYQN